MDVTEQFWSKVDKSGDCWLWLASRNNKGYGTFQGGMAHVWAWEQENGPVPDGLELDHTCFTPPCIRPSHLDAVTHRENLMRGDTLAAQHAAVTHCPRGHAYTEENTYINGGKRNCRACKPENNHRAYLRRKGRGYYGHICVTP